MKTRTLLVDSNYLLKRSFHANNESYNSKLESIGVIYSFMTKIRQLITLTSANKVVAVFDGEMGGAMRHSIDPTYKANRKSKSWYDTIELSDAEIKKMEIEKESILYQKKRIQCYLEELYIRQLETETIEADDLIAQYCIDHHEHEELFLFTNDRDFLQLLDMNLTIYFSNIEEPVNKSNFYLHFPFHYTNALTMKIICGDVADNIKGCGFKEDGLISMFPDLEYKTLKVNDLYKMAKDINENRILEKKKPLKKIETLLNSKERLKLNYQLINLHKPMINDQGYEELAQLEMPLDPNNRGSKNLYKLMIEDEFLDQYKGTFVNYVTPFYCVIMYEKGIYENYIKNNK